MSAAWENLGEQLVRHAGFLHTPVKHDDHAEIRWCNCCPEQVGCVVARYDGSSVVVGGNQKTDKSRIPTDKKQDVWRWWHRSLKTWVNKFHGRAGFG